CGRRARRGARHPAGRHREPATDLPQRLHPEGGGGGERRRDRPLPPGERCGRPDPVPASPRDAARVHRPAGGDACARRAAVRGRALRCGRQPRAGGAGARRPDPPPLKLRVPTGPARGPRCLTPMPSLDDKELDMTSASFFESDTGILLRRRALLAGTGVLSAGALALLGGCEAMAAGPGARSDTRAVDPEADVRILNTALGAELEAVAADQVGAESGLLQKDVLALASRFQGHHREHADALAATVRKLGGSPVGPKARYDFPVDTLRNQADVLRFAA